MYISRARVALVGDQKALLENSWRRSSPGPKDIILVLMNESGMLV